MVHQPWPEARCNGRPRSHQIVRRMHDRPSLGTRVRVERLGDLPVMRAARGVVARPSRAAVAEVACGGGLPNVALCAGRHA